MTHDPLCPFAVTQAQRGNRCGWCDLIARVRQDQNQLDTKMRTVFFEQGERDGYVAALQDAASLVRKTFGEYPLEFPSDYAEALAAAIEALGDKQ